MTLIHPLRRTTAAPCLAALLLASATAHAQSPAPPATSLPATSALADAEAADLSEGEIVRWDPRTLRVTLRHGEIRNLGMSAMTMVFRVQDASVLGSLQPGDKVRFRAAQLGGAYQVAHIEKAQ